MAIRPRAHSVSTPPPLLQKAASRLGTSNIIAVEPHFLITPFLLSSISIRISSFNLRQKCHVFAVLSLQSRQHDLSLKSCSISRTDVSSNTKRHVHFKKNTFHFDLSDVTSGKTRKTNHNRGTSSSSAAGPPNLRNNGPPPTPLELFHSLVLEAHIYEVLPSDEDSTNSNTRLAATGSFLLSSLSTYSFSHSSDESHPHTPNDKHRKTDSTGRNGENSPVDSYSTTFSMGTYSSIINDSIEKDTRNTLNGIPATPLDEETTSFGSLALSIHFYRRSAKDDKKSKVKLLSLPMRISVIGNLITQNGITKYLNSGSDQLQKFHVRCFGIRNLPKPMRTFVTLKTTDDARSNSRARSGTPTTPPARNYVWTDTLVADTIVQLSQQPQQQQITSSSSISTSEQPKVGLFLTVAEYLKKTFVAKCVIPVDQAIQGEQYNFAIILNSEGSVIYVSLTPETSLSFQTSLFTKHPDLCYLEVFLHGVQRIRPQATSSDPFSSSPYLAVLHFESDVKKYLKNVQNEKPKLPMQTVRLDEPNSFDRLSPSASKISPPSRASLFPQWNYLFEIYQTIDEVFEPDAVVIVELFELDFPREANGEVRFVAWAAIPLKDFAQPGFRDGFVLRQSAILHMDSMVSEADTESCDFSSDCLPHDFAVVVEMRRWTSRFFLRREKQKSVAPSNYLNGTTSREINMIGKAPFGDRTDFFDDLSRFVVYHRSGSDDFQQYHDEDQDESLLDEYEASEYEDAEPQCLEPISELLETASDTSNAPNNEIYLKKSSNLDIEVMDSALSVARTSHSSLASVQSVGLTTAPIGSNQISPNGNTSNGSNSPKAFTESLRVLIPANNHPTHQLSGLSPPIGLLSPNMGFPITQHFSDLPNPSGNNRMGTNRLTASAPWSPQQTPISPAPASIGEPRFPKRHTNLSKSAHKFEKSSRPIPDPSSAEAMRNKMLLDLRIAELDLETVPFCPEKRVLTSILPQVRQLVVKGATIIAKATLSEQKAAMLASENMELKIQVQRLLAARSSGEAPATPSHGNTSSTPYISLSSSSGQPSSATPPSAASNAAPVIPQLSLSGEGSISKRNLLNNSNLLNAEHLQMMNDFKSLLEAHQQANMDYSKLAEEVGSRIAEDLTSAFASSLQQSRMDSTELDSGHAVDTASQTVVELKMEVTKLRDEIEQLQNRYLLTTSAYGEEVLVLRSKLREKKRQLSEFKKVHTSSAVHVAPHQKHYVALSPLTVPPAPWKTMPQLPGFNSGNISAHTITTSSSSSNLPSPLIIPNPSFQIKEGDISMVPGNLTSPTLRFISPRSEFTLANQAQAQASSSQAKNPLNNSNSIPPPSAEPTHSPPPRRTTHQ